MCKNTVNRVPKVLHRLVIVFITMTLISSCSKEIQHISSIHSENYRIDKRQPSDDDEIATLIAPYKEKLDATMNEVIGTVEKTMNKSKPNSALNNWMADVLLSQARKNAGEVDFALQNYGGIRIPSLAKGDVTVGKIYELMPFDNMLVVLSADGKVVQQMMDRIADYGGWPVSGGTTFRIDNGKAVDIIINGKPISLNNKYTFALPDYIANGGDGSDFLSATERTDLNLLVRDAIIQEIKDVNGKISYNDEIRIKTQ
ncbi:MAG: hypothetical protein HKN68_21545 [Saprospiraceae bacterium]|nr:hypothetical protein [Saprospiraceae bacterium]